MSNAKVYQPIYLLMICADTHCLSLGDVTNKVAWIFLCEPLYSHTLSFTSGNYLGIEWLNQYFLMNCGMRPGGSKPGRKPHRSMAGLESSPRLGIGKCL
jgi:hypothetical protein